MLRAVLALLFFLFFSLSALAQVTVTPSTYSFGNHPVGEAIAPKLVTLTNTQTVPLTISSIAIAGGTAPGDYTWGGNCPISPKQLAAGRSCTITVTFAPSALGSLTATLTVTDNASNSPQTVALSGTGTAPVAVSPTSLTFASRLVGTTSAANTVSVLNHLNTQLLFSSIVVSGPFAIASNTCGSGIAAGAKCTVGITFTPTAIGPLTGTLTINYNAFGSPSLVALSGTGNDNGLTSINVTPANPSIPAGTARQFTATGNFRTGGPQNLTSFVAWSSGQSNVAAIAAGGLATGLTVGSSTISATLGSTSGTTTLTVTAPTLVSITVTPANPSIAAGNAQQFTATGTYSDNSTQNLTSTAAWSSSSPGVATIAAGGLATGVTAGTSSISAMVGSITGSTTLTVTPPVLVSIAVAPANPSISAGTTQQFTATGTYSDNSTQNLTSTATWSSSASSLATISAAGLASALAPGQATLTAASGAINGSTSLTVTAGFDLTGSLNAARFGHTTTLLNNGTALVAGGSNGAALAAAELYNPAAGTFAPAGNMNTASIYHTATLLNNGVVLLVGGLDNNGNILASAELYNPTNGTFTPTGSLNTARYEHTATLLNNGMVLIAGGQDSSGNTLSSAELYNPASGTFSSTGSLNTARFSHTATLLNDGTVLIAGGQAPLPSCVIPPCNAIPMAAAELYNPAAGIFTPTGSLNTARAYHTATLLNNGMALLTGGLDNNGNILASAELYNSATASFTPAGSLNTARYFHSAALLNNGTVLIAGGTGASPYLASAELYDPNANAFTVTGNLNTARDNHTATLLTNGTVLIAGGGGSSGILASAELYQPASMTPPNLVSISISPSNPTVPLDTAQPMIATGTFNDNSTEQLASVTWSSSDPAAVTITDDASDSGSAYALGAGSASVSACVGSLCGSTTLTVGPPALVSLTVTPANTTVPTSLLLQFDALGTYSDGSQQDLTSSVTWASSAPNVASINSTGLASTWVVGSTTITASLGAVQSTTTLIVDSGALVSIAVTPSNPSVAVGNSQQFTATGTYSDNSTQNLTIMATWSSSSTGVATISAAGLAAGATTGASNISATVGSINGSATLTVTAPTLVSIAVTPANGTVPAGYSLQFDAVGTFSDGSNQDLTSSVTWSSSAPDVATINSAGLTSSLLVGNTNITATSGTVQGTTTLTVNSAILVSIAVSPATPSIAAGTTQQFTATGTYSDNSTQNLTSTATWSSSATGVATIAAGGLATAVTVGNSTISATVGSISGSASLTVASATPASIAVTPANPSITVGNTQQFTATGTYTDNSTQDLTSIATWSSSATTVATIAPGGLATSATVGDSTISATVGTITGTTTLTVTNSSQLPLGTVSAVTSETCPSSVGGSPGAWVTETSGGHDIQALCYHATVSCPNMPDLGVTYGVATPSGTSLGTVVFVSASGGITTLAGNFIDDAPFDLFHFGYQTVQFAWDSTWQMGSSSGSLKVAACRVATFLNYAYSQYYQTNSNNSPIAGMCAQGQSGGAGGLAFSLTDYGASAFLDKAVFVSGPQYANLVQGCSVPNYPPVDICPSQNGNYPMGCNSAAGTWTDSPLYTKNAASNMSIELANDPPCNNPSHTYTAQDELNLAATSVVDGSADSNFNYPQTGITAWECDDDSIWQNSSEAEGWLYLSQFSNPSQVAPNCNYSGDNTPFPNGCFAVHRVFGCPSTELAASGYICNGSTCPVCTGNPPTNCTCGGVACSTVTQSYAMPVFREADYEDPVNGCIKRH